MAGISNDRVGGYSRRDRLGAWFNAQFPDRPLEYSSVSSWLLAGGTRDWRSLWVAYLFGWGLLPSTVLGLISGAVGGAVVGFSGSLSVAHFFTGLPVVGAFITWAWSGLAGVLGAVIGFFLGALLGALIGFVYLPLIIVGTAWGQGGLLQVLMVVSLTLIVTVLLAIGYTLWAILSEGPRTGISGYRRMSRREAEFLVPLVHDCAARLGCRNAPRILIDDADEPQAYALTRHIVLTQGLLTMTEANEAALAGVICHELVHWRNADTVNSLVIKGLALPAYLLYNLAGRRERAGKSRRFLVTLFTLPTRLTMRFIFLPACARESRVAEFRADQGAVYARLATGLVDALEGFRELEAGRSGWDEAILATHPPTELRIERLLPYLAVVAELPASDQAEGAQS